MRELTENASVSWEVRDSARLGMSTRSHSIVTSAETVHVWDPILQFTTIQSKRNIKLMWFTTFTYDDATPCATFSRYAFKHTVVVFAVVL